MSRASNRGRRRLTPGPRRRFLAALRQGHTVAAAARSSGFAWSTLYSYRNSDPDFAAAWAAALEAGTDRRLAQSRRGPARAPRHNDRALSMLLCNRRGSGGQAGDAGP